MVFSVLKNGFFRKEKTKYFSFLYSEFFLEISSISYKKTKKQIDWMLKII